MDGWVIQKKWEMRIFDWDHNYQNYSTENCHNYDNLQQWTQSGMDYLQSVWLQRRNRVNVLMEKSMILVSKNRKSTVMKFSQFSQHPVRVSRARRQRGARQKRGQKFSIASTLSPAGEFPAARFPRVFPAFSSSSGPSMCPRGKRKGKLKARSCHNRSLSPRLSTRAFISRILISPFSAALLNSIFIAPVMRCKFLSPLPLRRKRLRGSGNVAPIENNSLSYLILIDTVCIPKE